MAEKQDTPEAMLEEAILKGEPSPATPTVAEESESVADFKPPPVRGRTGSVVGWVSRGLVLGAVLLLLLSGYETYSSLPSEMPEWNPRRFDTGIARVDINEMPFHEAVDRFARRRIFGDPPPPGDDDTRDPTGARGWRAYVREHMVLKGISAVGTGDARALEAIVLDAQTERLQFLQEGHQIKITGQDVTVARIGDNQLELQHDEEVLILD